MGVWKCASDCSHALRNIIRGESEWIRRRTLPNRVGSIYLISSDHSPRCIWSWVDLSVWALRRTKSGNRHKVCTSSRSWTTLKSITLNRIIANIRVWYEPSPLYHNLERRHCWSCRSCHFHWVCWCHNRKYSRIWTEASLIVYSYSKIVLCSGRIGISWSFKGEWCWSETSSCQCISDCWKSRWRTPL
jgi:hypothetical protein